MRNWVIILFFFCLKLSFGQDKSYARNVVDTLTSNNYAGRGYVKNGHIKAANFIAKEFTRFGLKYFEKEFKQEYQIDVNTFEGLADLYIDNQPLLAGIDFLVDPSCPAIEGTFKLKWLDNNIVGDTKKISQFISSDLSDVFLVIDAEGIDDPAHIQLVNEMVNNPFNAKGIIIVKSSKLTWSVSGHQKNIL